MTIVESLSGIRGIFGVDLKEENASKYAFSYLSFIKTKIKNPKIVIGTDTRISRENLKNVIIEILDCSIMDVGIACES